MSIAAIYRVHNAIAMDYPFKESVEQALLLCDEVCIATGYSSDNTLDIILELGKRYGKERVKYIQYNFVFNREWQVIAWDRAKSLTKCDWHLLIDADEAFHEKDIDELKALTKEKRIKLINFPVRHFYGTPNFLVTGGHFYKRHTRLGYKSINMRMRNFRQDNNLAPVCDVVATIEGIERKVHTYHGPDILYCNIPIYHYGWVRSANAMAMRRIKGRAWYLNSNEYFDGHLPQIKRNFSYKMIKNKSLYKRFSGSHPQIITEWFSKEPHQREWTLLEDEVKNA